jgi:hypothetical protein
MSVPGLALAHIAFTHSFPTQFMHASCAGGPGASGGGVCRGDVDTGRRPLRQTTLLHSFQQVPPAGQIRARCHTWDLLPLTEFSPLERR